MEFLREHQLNIMLFLSGACGIMAVLTLVTKTLSPRRRRILAALELTAMLLLLFDRYAYIYRGDVSRTGYWMVRVCNFMVYFLTLNITHEVSLYLFDLFQNEGGMAKMPRRLLACEILYAVGVVLLVVAHFTGLYYTFDAQNNYQRAAGNLISYVAPISMVVLQLTLVIQHRRRLNRNLVLSLILNSAVPLVVTVIQLFAYGVSLINMSLVGMAALLYLFALIELNERVDRAQRREIEYYKEARQKEHALFEQTAQALANAIDAKDRYTHGHSARVAMYSQQIAQAAGMSQEECEKVYFAALLHDVGKIGIRDAIINKDGKLTEEEFAQIKLHPVFGDQILTSIQQSPYLSIGAHYHHERYDGRGYPDGLKGEDIPALGRVIAVADAYDAMTSKRSYREPIPQQKVREQLLMGMGTQFDPEYARIMLHLIDRDTEFRMRERATGSDGSFKTRLRCERLYQECSTGILIVDHITRIHLFAGPMEDEDGPMGMPALIVFDALDGRVHRHEDRIRDLLYVEYGQIRFDGQVLCEEARKMETRETPREAAAQDAAEAAGSPYARYDIEAVRYEDHMMIRVADRSVVRETIIALPDSSRFSYLSLTGEHCQLSNIQVEQDEAAIGADCIPRIAEAISYIRDCPEGDLPNIQIDRWRSGATRGVPIAGDMTVRFHAQSLPTARLVWHCPFVSIFTSRDGTIGGPNFREFVLIRLDGENWESDAHADNETQINRIAAFEGWKVWKQRNLEGIDCAVAIHREGNRVVVDTENLGIAIHSVTTVKDKVDDIYFALTGDQCALTNIRVETHSTP